MLEILITDSSDRDERVGSVRCPDLLGPLIVKAAATTITGRENPGRDWQDVAVLLSILHDPIGSAEQLRKRDRQHLGRLRPLLAHPTSAGQS